MLRTGTRALTPLALLMAAFGTATAQAQLFPWPNPCLPYAHPMSAVHAPIIPMAPVALAPAVQTASIDCPCLRPVTETVYQDVEQVDYRTVQQTVKRPKVVTVMEDRDVVTYQTVNEARTVSVPSYINQTVTEMRPLTINQSYWQTHMQPVPKFSPCQYDPRPGMVGELNRLGYAMRNAFTPNYVARREFVPNVVATEVPVQRVVQIPTTREVTYNVARVVPVTTTQKVAVQRTVWEDDVVTAYEPYVTRKRVAVGTRTRMAYVDASGGTTASAEPTPATATGNNNSQSADKGTLKQNSAPHSGPPIQNPIYREQPPQSQPPQPQPPQQPPVQFNHPPQTQTQPAFEEAPVADSSGPVPSVIRVAGWRATRPERAGEPHSQPLQGPILSVAKK